jgi:hypothetical protein
MWNIHECQNNNGKKQTCLQSRDQNMSVFTLIGINLVCLGGWSS